MVNLNQLAVKLAKILIRRENLIALLQEHVEFLKGNNTEFMLIAAQKDAAAIKEELERRRRDKNFDNFLNERDCKILKPKGTPAPLSYTGGKPKEPSK